jgi:hypothetical protein
MRMIPHRTKTTLAPAVLFLLALASLPASAQAVKAGTMLLEALGASQVVLRAIESTFGRASPELARLLALPPAERGLAAIGSDSVVSSILSSGTLGVTEQRAFVATVNTFRLESAGLGNATLPSGRAWSEVLGAASPPNHPLGVFGENMLAGSGGGSQSSALLGAKRTWSLTPPIGDIKVEPPIEVPLVTLGRNAAQVKIDNIPTGKIAVGATACMQLECIDFMRDRLGGLLGSDPKPILPAPPKP